MRERERERERGREGGREEGREGEREGEGGRERKVSRCMCRFWEFVRSVSHAGSIECAVVTGCYSLL